MAAPTTMLSEATPLLQRNLNPPLSLKFGHLRLRGSSGEAKSLNYCGLSKKSIGSQPTGCPIWIFKCLTKIIGHVTWTIGHVTCNICVQNIVDVMPNLLLP